MRTYRVLVWYEGLDDADRALRYVEAGGIGAALTKMEKEFIDQKINFRITMIEEVRGI
jgi:hypothetical protein